MIVESVQNQFEKEYRYLSLIAEIRKSFYSRSEQELFQTFLESTTHFFDLAKAWYGICSGNTIRPVFHAGTAQNCIDIVQVCMKTELPEISNSEFPLTQAIAKKQPIVVPYLDQQKQFSQWKTFLENSKCRSILAVPVEIHNKIEGGFVFYSFLPEPFDPSTIDDLVRCIGELTGIISEKRHWTKQLRELKKSKEIAEADALKKTRFLANMSHEIRTPMTAILGFTEILLHDYLAPTQNQNENNRVNENNKTNEIEETKRINETNTLSNPPTLESSLNTFNTLEHCKNIAQIIQSNAEFLLSILNDILDFSKLEADMLKVEKIAVPFQPFLCELAMFYLVQARAKNLVFSIKPLTPLPQFINTDPVRFKQILVNLIGNAIKFTQHGTITISIAWVDADNQNFSKENQSEKNVKDIKTDGNLFFSVKDTGIGISQEVLSTLFVPFQQANTETTRRFGGSGLGLVISKRFIRLLGGEMIVKSREGLGSTFTVVLPQQFDYNIQFETFSVLESLPVNFRNKSAIFETPNWSNSDSNSDSSSDSNSDSDSGTITLSLSLAGRRILLVEDSIDNLRLFSLIMRKAGAEVVDAENGQVAVEIVAKNLNNTLPFDIILMDMEMPVMDGYTATRQLRKMGYTNPIIALTAHTLSEEHQKCLDAGCNDYIMKPILRNALIAAILKFLNPNTEIKTLKSKF
ncbi:MAG: response regulator [Planctomycetaceae bacterium]|jgi:signal transduction histidine kinase/CheY-like chemotaxis protein|nr:response regulator [Planctomycetaceae bacterium]